MLRTYLVYNTVVRLCQFFCCDGKVLLRPGKKIILVVCLVGCAVVQFLILAGNRQFFIVAVKFYYERKKKF